MVAQVRPEDFTCVQSGRFRTLSESELHLEMALEALRNIRDQESQLLAEAQETARNTLEVIDNETA